MAADFAYEVQPANAVTPVLRPGYYFGSILAKHS